MIQFLPRDDSDAYAIQALARGEATEAQQMQAFRCIVEELCGTYEMTFDPGSSRQSDFNEGKRHVGRCLVGLVKLNIGKIADAEKRKIKAIETIRKGRNK